MDIEYIDHIGVAVSDPAAAAAFLTDILGAEFLHEGTWEYEGQSFTYTQFSLGSRSSIELIHSPDPDNFINRYIDKRGEGIHHITIKVTDLDNAIAELEGLGIDVVDVNKSDSSYLEAFIRPRDAFGILIQLAEFKESS